MRVLVLCGGAGSRWTGPGPKQLVEVEGERLLDRTLRLLKQRGVLDLTVVADPEELKVPGVFVAPPVDSADEWKVDSAGYLWDTRKQIVLLCGDVYFTPLALDVILSYEPAPFAFFGRRQRSNLTGGKWGEIFGLSVAPEAAAQVRVLDAAADVRAKVRAGDLERGKMWEVYQTLIGEEPNPFGKQVFDGHWVDIDDWTEDFDTPEELEEWLRRRRL